MEKQNVTLKDLKAINLADARHQFITMPFYWVLVLIAAGWIGKAWVADALGFVTQAQAEEKIEPLKQKVNKLGTDVENLDRKFDQHISEFRLTGAFQMEQALKANLARHQNEPDDTPGHMQDILELTRQVNLAGQYKECLLQENNHCEVIRKQLIK